MVVGALAWALLGSSDGGGRADRGDRAVGRCWFIAGVAARPPGDAAVATRWPGDAAVATRPPGDAAVATRVPGDAVRAQPGTVLDAGSGWRAAASVLAALAADGDGDDLTSGREEPRRARRRSRALLGATLPLPLPLLLVAGVVVGWFARRRWRALAAERDAALALSHQQTRLLSDEETFRRLIEAIGDYAIFQLDPDGRVSAWNLGATHATGWSAEAVRGRPLSLLFHESDGAAPGANEILQAAARDGFWRGECRWLRRDDSRFVAEVLITAVRDGAGPLVGFSVVARDLTAQRRSDDAIGRLNRELEQRVAELAGANAELEAFSYSVSHDLRGPLRAIDGFSKILAEQYRGLLDQQAQHYLDRVRAGSQRMGHLIDDLLSLSKVTRSEMRYASIDLAQIGREAIEELRRHDGARCVEVRIAEALPARGDARLIRAMLDNLLGNAWKFTGRVTSAVIELGSAPHDGGRAFFVRDNGAGFDMAYVDKLFAPFQRLHEVHEFEGTGIGLATVHRIVTRHGGRIWAEASPGRGATFWFTLGSAS